VLKLSQSNVISPIKKLTRQVSQFIL